MIFTPIGSADHTQAHTHVHSVVAEQLGFILSHRQCSHVSIGSCKSWCGCYHSRKNKPVFLCLHAEKG